MPISSSMHDARVDALKRIDDERKATLKDPEARERVRDSYPVAVRPILLRLENGTWYGLDCEPGWYDLLAKLDADIAALDPNYTVGQVKQKFGTLRYYVERVDDKVAEQVDRLVGIAEEQSATICEACGEAGELGVVDHWYCTRCPSCAKELPGWQPHD